MAFLVIFGLKMAVFALHSAIFVLYPIENNTFLVSGPYLAAKIPCYAVKKPNILTQIT